MPRPVARGGARGWSLAQIAQAAQVSRGVARAAQSRGFFSSPLQRSDIVLAQVAAACLEHPDPDTRLGHLGPRDRLAVHLTQAAFVDPATNLDTVLTMSSGSAELSQLSGPYSPRYPAPGFPPAALWPAEPGQRSALVVLPVGAWISKVLTVSAPSFPASLAMVTSTPRPGQNADTDDPFGDYATG